MAVVNERKSLMLDKVQYDQISSLAKKAGVARPVVVAALLASADESKVLAALVDIRASERVNAGEERKKRNALSALAGQLDMSQIEALLAQAAKKGITAT